jgi:hypothetical protein
MTLEQQEEHDGLLRLGRVLHMLNERDRRSAEVVRRFGPELAARIDPWLFIQERIESGGVPRHEDESPREVAA